MKNKNSSNENNHNIANKSSMTKLLIAAVTASILVLSIGIYSTMQGQSMASMAIDMSSAMSGNTNSATSQPQPNDKTTVVKAEASNALFEPNAGKTNVFGPGGIFPMNKTFSCGNALTCGVSAGNDANFMGTFEQGNTNSLTGYQATYTSPVTYGPEQIAGHKYQLVLTDTMWNGTGAAMPTRQAEYLKLVNNVGFNQIQHGASHIDRADVPQLFDTAFLYGHVKVIDMSDGNKVVAQNVFTHVMVAHVMNETTFYRGLRDDAASPTMVFIFAINIPSGVPLPGVGTLTPVQAQSFTPLSTDPSLTHSPQFAYPVSIEHANTTVGAPMPQSVTWPVDDPSQPLLFDFLVYQSSNVQLESMSSNSNGASVSAGNSNSNASPSSATARTQGASATATAGGTTLATITATAGTQANTVTISGHGFTPNTQVTTIMNNDSSTTTRTQTDSSGSFTSTLAISASSPGTMLPIKTTAASTGVSAATTFTVP
jgi:hypothetical protein